MAASSNFPKRADEVGYSFLDRIEMTDESMFNLFDPETKMESSIRKRTASPSLLKSVCNHISVSSDVNCFHGPERNLAVHKAPQGYTVNADYCSKVK